MSYNIVNNTGSVKRIGGKVILVGTTAVKDAYCLKYADKLTRAGLKIKKTEAAKAAPAKIAQQPADYKIDDAVNDEKAEAKGSEAAKTIVKSDKSVNTASEDVKIETKTNNSSSSKDVDKVEPKSGEADKKQDASKSEAKKSDSKSESKKAEDKKAATPTK